MKICFHKHSKRIFTYVNIAENHCNTHYYILTIRYIFSFTKV